MSDSGTVLLRVRGLHTYFETEFGTVKAVDGVDFDLRSGETLGVVGESGCGKSVTAMSIMQLLPPSRTKLQGSIEYYHAGRKIEISGLDPKGKEMRALRGNEIAMIFQEPMTSLIRSTRSATRLWRPSSSPGCGQIGSAREAIQLLERVGLSSPRQQVDQYPHQLSGGMRQRVMIAMALSCNPTLLIADEPTTALDVTIEAQILDLMRDLKQEFGMAIMLITHSLGVVAEMCNRVIVMYLGKIVDAARRTTSLQSKTSLHAAAPQVHTDYWFERKA